MNIVERYRKVRVPALSGLEQVWARLEAAERRRVAGTAQQVAAGQLLLHDPEVRLALGPEQEARAYERLNDLEASIGLPPTPYTDVPKQEFAKQIHAGQVTVAERALPAGERETLLDNLAEATIARFGTTRVARYLVDQRNQQTLAQAAMRQGQGKPKAEATEPPMEARQWVRSLIEPYAPAAPPAAPEPAQQQEGPVRSAGPHQQSAPVASTAPEAPAAAPTASGPAISAPRPVAAGARAAAAEQRPAQRGGTLRDRVLAAAQQAAATGRDQAGTYSNCWEGAIAVYRQAGAGNSRWTNQGDPQPGDIVDFHNPETHGGPHSVIFIGWNDQGMDCYSYDHRTGYRRHTYAVDRGDIYHVFHPVQTQLAPRAAGPVGSPDHRSPGPMRVTSPEVPATEPMVSGPAMSAPPTIRPVAPPTAEAPSAGTMQVTLTSAPSAGTGGAAPPSGRPATQQMGKQAKGGAKRRKGMDPSKAVAAFPTAPKLLDAFLDECQKQGVDPALALSMGWWESRGQWKHEANSGAGAHGIMQLTADTASKFGVKDPKDADPVENVRAGVRVIKYLFDKYPKSKYGDKQLDYVVAAYNRGETKLNKDIRAGVSFDAFPVETRDYLVAVHTLMPQFTVLLAEREKKAKQAAGGGAAKK